jgi:hypothetical protein
VYRWQRLNTAAIAIPKQAIEMALRLDSFIVSTTRFRRRPHFSLIVVDDLIIIVVHNTLYLDWKSQQHHGTSWHYNSHL